MAIGNEKRCTPFPGSFNINSDNSQEDTGAGTACASSGAVDKAGQSPNKLRKRPQWRPPPLPLSVRQVPEKESSKRCSRQFPENGSPWDRYRPFTRRRSCGKIVLAHDIRMPKTVVAFRDCKPSNAVNVQHLIKTAHTNLVNLRDAFIDRDIVYLAYERMDLPLEQLHSDVRLEEGHIATVCREVVQPHGEIGSSMLAQQCGMERRDIKSVGWIMTEIMEPQTADLDPETIHLEKPEQWSREILGFQQDTEHSSIPQLLSHPFSAHAAPSTAGFLTPLILVALKHWQA
ncbi:predicted protein [Uncinocarpus reesii 1704]|uniref:Protein kinase domain-containing protein n=1 Tax=Uncinocarpus reesii (strain UAMH 1704) TaxID=336963 RepID=C4K0A1_UNCRE|nr:uncharacterized protein UREG_07915 [Uncinocarpus reesii 1704]EEP83050.1 predicted protein [Uncinocarpus reesii 1704]